MVNVRLNGLLRLAPASIQNGVCSGSPSSRRSGLVLHDLDKRFNRFLAGFLGQLFHVSRDPHSRIFLHAALGPTVRITALSFYECHLYNLVLTVVMIVYAVDGS
mgnify:CR=1 FL=1